MIEGDYAWQSLAYTTSLFRRRYDIAPTTLLSGRSFFHGSDKVASSSASSGPYSNIAATHTTFFSTELPAQVITGRFAMGCLSQPMSRSTQRERPIPAASSPAFQCLGGCGNGE